MIENPTDSDRSFCAFARICVFAGLIVTVTVIGCTDRRAGGPDAADAARDTLSADTAVVSDSGPSDTAQTDDTGVADSGTDTGEDDTGDRDTSADTRPVDSAPDAVDTIPLDTGTDTADTAVDTRDTRPLSCGDGYTKRDGSCVESQLEKHVHIYISNTCKLSVTPASVDVPRGQTISFTYHNHSTDYAADVWLSYGGGYLDLKQGKTWDDQFVHCRHGSRPYTAAAEISINGLNLRDDHCPGHKMTINCK